MNNKDLNKKVDTLIEKVKFPPERNRECIYCSKPFYAHNLNQLSCSEKCYQTHYNERIRPVKELERTLAALKSEQYAMEELKRSLRTPENNLRRNIEIIEHLTIDPLVGTQYQVDQLIKAGIDFTTFDYKEKVQNTKDSFELIMGQHRLTLIDENSIQISFNL